MNKKKEKLMELIRLPPNLQYVTIVTLHTQCNTVCDIFIWAYFMEVWERFWKFRATDTEDLRLQTSYSLGLILEVFLAIISISFDKTFYSPK